MFTGILDLELRSIIVDRLRNLLNNMLIMYSKSN